MMPERRGFGAVQTALQLTAVIIEFCWLYPWLLFLTGLLYEHPPTPVIPAGPSLLLLMGAAVTVRRAVGMNWPLPAIRSAVLGIGLLAGLAAVKATHYPAYAAWDLRWVGVLLGAAHDTLPDVPLPVAGAVIAALLWWRGVVLGGREFSYVEIDRLFRGGIGWSVLFVILFAIYHDSRAFALAAYAPLYLLAFFSLSLLALAVSRLVDLWSQTHADERQALAMNRHWLLLLAGVVGLILLAAMLVSGVMPGDLRPVLARVLAPLAPVLEAVFTVVFWVALVVARIIIGLIHLIARGGRRPVVPEPRGDPLADLLRDLQQVRVDPGVVSGARWGMVLLAVALLCLLIAIAIVRARRRERKPGEDERESVWSTRAALAGLGAALRSLWRRRGAVMGVAEDAEVAAIRAMYRDLLRIGREMGVPRRDSETPYEYRPRLSGQLQAVPDAIAELTEAYVRVRYSAQLPAEDDIERARTALDRIRDALMAS
jgi:hypothetical protein